MTEKKKVIIVNSITGSRFIGALLLPLIVTLLGPLGTAVYIGLLWASDALDGHLAKRKWHVSTIFGASLDAFCDKVLGIAILIYLYAFYPFVLLPLIFELAIFGINWHYGKKGSDVKSSVIGKVKSGVLYFSTVLAILSTISLTSSLAMFIPTLMGITSIFQLKTLTDYVAKNKKYLKENKPRNDVSKLKFIDTLKEIFRLLKDPKLYSPTYYKEHKNESLLDILYDEESKTDITVNKTTDNLQENISKESTKGFTNAEKNELIIKYELNNKEIKMLENFCINHNITFLEINEYLKKYKKTLNINEMNFNISSFINHIQIKRKTN